MSPLVRSLLLCGHIELSEQLLEAFPAVDTVCVSHSGSHDAKVLDMSSLTLDTINKIRLECRFAITGSVKCKLKFGPERVPADVASFRTDARGVRGAQCTVHRLPHHRPQELASLVLSNDFCAKLVAALPHLIEVTFHGIENSITFRQHNWAISKHVKVITLFPHY